MSTLPGEIWTHIGRRMREARLASGLSQDALAARAGLFRTSICNIEAGRQATDAVRLALIARAIGVTLNDLVQLDDLTGSSAG